MFSHVPVLVAITIKNLPACQQKHAVELRFNLHFSVNNNNLHYHTKLEVNGTRMQMTKVLWGIFSSNSHIKISPVQISHFSSANLTFLQCQSHISPVPISHFSSANLTYLQCKSHISPVQISHFSSANLTFLQCKSHISPVQISHFSNGVYLFRLLLLRLLLVSSTPFSSTLAIVC